MKKQDIYTYLFVNQERKAVNRMSQDRKKQLKNLKDSCAIAKGRKETKYSPELDSRVYDLCRNEGLTYEELSYVIGVSVSTLRRWQDLHPSFSYAMDKGRLEHCREHLEKSLLNRALGYTFQETEHIYDGEGNLSRRKVSTKQMHPDTRAIQFFLRSRDPERWGPDAKVIEHKHAHQVDVTNLSTDELRKMSDIMKGAKERNEELKEEPIQISSESTDASKIAPEKDVDQELEEEVDAEVESYE